VVPSAPSTVSAFEQRRGGSTEEEEGEGSMFCTDFLLLLVCA
jgi:hypothetical protein